MGLEPRPCDGGLSMARRSTAMEHGAEFGVHCERRLRALQPCVHTRFLRAAWTSGGSLVPENGKAPSGMMGSAPCAVRRRLLSNVAMASVSGSDGRMRVSAGVATSEFGRIVLGRASESTLRSRRVSDSHPILQAIPGRPWSCLPVPIGCVPVLRRVLSPATRSRRSQPCRRSRQRRAYASALPIHCAGATLQCHRRSTSNAPRSDSAGVWGTLRPAQARRAR